MPNITPDALFPNMTADATSITIPFTDLEIDATDADPTTGNGAVLIFRITEKVADKYFELPTDQRPTRFVVVRGAQNRVDGAESELYSQTNSFTFVSKIDSATLPLAPES